MSDSKRWPDTIDSPDSTGRNDRPPNARMRAFTRTFPRYLRKKGKKDKTEKKEKEEGEEGEEEEEDGEEGEEGVLIGCLYGVNNGS